MQLWIQILIGVFLFLFAFLLFNYFKLTFIMNEVKGKKLKRGSQEEIGLFLYYLQHGKFKPIIKPFLKDTFRVVIDSIVISGLVLSIINREWYYAILLIIFRLFIYIETNKFKNKEYFIDAIEKDTKSFKEFMKERKIKQKSFMRK